jgi:membrane associated rhomboid family serine protease
MSYVLTPDSLKRAYLTHIFLGINILCFIIGNLIIGWPVIVAVVLNYELVVGQGEWWRLLTSIFFHWDINHIFSNMLALLFYGASMEQNYSRKQYFLIYIISGLGGSVSSLLLNPVSTFSLGASGAIYGIMGAVFISTARQNRSVLIIGVIYITYNLIYSFSPGIGTWAHIFGLVFGLGLGYFFWKQNMKSKNTQKNKIYYV